MRDLAHKRSGRMAALTLVICVCCLGLMRGADTAGQATVQKWKLVWSDEFNTAGMPDPNKWEYEEGYKRNKELQYYTKARRENARVEDGCLVIETRKDNFEGHAITHTKANNHMRRTNKGDKIDVSDPSKNFHVYAIEWFEDRIDFYVDQSKYFTFKNEGTGNDVWPFDKPHYLILNAAYGGSWGGQKGTDDAILPQKYLIDYVRVYKSQ